MECWGVCKDAGWGAGVTVQPLPNSQHCAQWLQSSCSHSPNEVQISTKYPWARAHLPQDCPSADRPAPLQAFQGHLPQPCLVRRACRRQVQLGRAKGTAGWQVDTRKRLHECLTWFIISRSALGGQVIRETHVGALSVIHVNMENYRILYINSI